jgi:hypothetical protein
MSSRVTCADTKNLAVDCWLDPVAMAADLSVLGIIRPAVMRACVRVDALVVPAGPRRSGAHRRPSESIARLREPAPDAG